MSKRSLNTLKTSVTGAGAHKKRRRRKVDPDIQTFLDTNKDKVTSQILQWVCDNHKDFDPEFVQRLFAVLQIDHLKEKDDNPIQDLHILTRGEHHRKTASTRKKDSSTCYIPLRGKKIGTDKWIEFHTKKELESNSGCKRENARSVVIKKTKKTKDCHGEYWIFEEMPDLIWDGEVWIEASRDWEVRQWKKTTKVWVSNFGRVKVNNDRRKMGSGTESGHVYNNIKIDGFSYKVHRLIAMGFLCEDTYSKYSKVETYLCVYICKFLRPNLVCFFL